MNRRNRPATEDRIRSAAWNLLAREGLPAWGVNAVAREAGVDKVLLYRYFGGLETILHHLMEQQRFWPDPGAIETPGARAFLRASLPLLEQSRPLHCLLSLPPHLPTAAEAARRYAVQEEEWLAAFLLRCEGRAERDLVKAWGAFISTSVLLRPSDLSVPTLWSMISPPLHEAPVAADFQPEELPTELL